MTFDHSFWDKPQYCKYFLQTCSLTGEKQNREQNGLWSAFNDRANSVHFTLFSKKTWGYSLSNPFMALNHRYVLRWIRGECERVANSGVLGSFTSLCNLPSKTTRPYHISVFQKCEPVVYGRLGS